MSIRAFKVSQPECTAKRPKKRAEVHNNVVEYKKIVVNKGLVRMLNILKCLDCGREVPDVL